MSFFLTGTDTGVGKTHTAVHLLRLARAAGINCAAMKPICCGDRQDAELLLAASSDGLTIDELNPVWLKTPAAPFSAASMEQVEIDIRALLAQLESLRARFDFVVVEGVGGWMVPIRQGYFVADLAREMELPVLLVVRNRLGCLNHTILTLGSIEAHGLRCAAIILNSGEHPSDVASATNFDVLRQMTSVPVVPGLDAGTAELPVGWRQILKH